MMGLGTIRLARPQTHLLGERPYSFDFRSCLMIHPYFLALYGVGARDCSSAHTATVLLSASYARAHCI